MTDEKTPLDQALELLVYAPIGLAMTAREELPRLIERGRSQVTGQVAMARMIGQFAVAQGQREAEKVVKQATERLGDLSVGGRPVPSTPRPATAAPAAATTNGSAPSTEREDIAPSAKGPEPGAASTRTSAASADDDHLAIPGYDALSASQVVTRLAGLSDDELEAVRSYEAGTRGRKTILHRIGQLQSGSAT